MGDVLITYKIMPDGPEAPLNDMKEEIGSVIADMCTRFSIEEHPVAFGLVALHVKVVMPDKTGEPDKVEDALGTVFHAESVESIGVGLL